MYFYSFSLYFAYMGYYWELDQSMSNNVQQKSEHNHNQRRATFISLLLVVLVWVFLTVAKSCFSIEVDFSKLFTQSEQQKSMWTKLWIHFHCFDTKLILIFQKS